VAVATKVLSDKGGHLRPGVAQILGQALQSLLAAVLDVLAVDVEERRDVIVGHPPAQRQLQESAVVRRKTLQCVLYALRRRG
jgi:hypothetical protein